MADKNDILRVYADILSADADDAMTRIVGRLDTAGSGYRSLQPPPRLLDARIIPNDVQHRNADNAPARLRPDPDLNPTKPVGEITDRRRSATELMVVPGRRRSHIRPLLEIAAASIMFVIVAAVLIAVFSRSSDEPGNDRSNERSANPLPQSVPLQPRDGILLSIEEAKQHVRIFLSEPDADLDGRLLNPREADGNLVSRYPDIDLFLLTRVVPGQNIPDTFVVDADTGEILQVVSAKQDVGNDGSIPSEEMAMVAETFAAAHFIGFEQLSPAEHWLVQPDTSYLTDLGDFDPAFRPMGFDPSGRPGTVLFHWRLHSDNPDGWLSTFVSVGINEETGKVVYYAGRHADDTTLNAPTISRDDAIEVALSQTQTADPNLSDVTAGHVALVTHFQDAWQDRWIWAIEITSRGSSASGSTGAGLPRYWGIDAVTGEVVTGMMVTTP